MVRFYQYIDDVLTGKVITGNLVKLAVKRHCTDIKRKNFKYRFDEEKASKIIKFAEICRHWKGDKSGQRIELQPHQVFYFASIFGWVDKETGLRRFKQSYKEVARKNGKTTELAVISLFHLLFDNEKGAQVYCAATKEDQARILVNDAAQITLTTPELKEKFKLFKYRDIYNRVYYPSAGSFIAALGGDSTTQDGLDPSIGNIDEFHEHKTDALLNVIESGMGSRQQPLINIITTAGFNKNYPCFSVKRKTAIDILKGILKDDTFFALIYTLDEEDDWKDSDNWIKANPNYGVSVKKQFLKDSFTKAINEGGNTEVNFKTKHLNIWTDAAKTWIQDEVWLKNNDKIDINSLVGCDCYGGLDLAASIDLNAFSLYFPSQRAFLRWFWMPEDKLKANKDGVDYIRWMNEGYILTTPGNVVDHEFIYAKIIEISKVYNVKSIAFDRFLAYHGVIQSLMKESITLNPFGQGFLSMSTPTKEYEKVLNNCEIENFNNPVIRWMIGNVELEMDAAGNIKPSKGKSSNKIDGVVADIMALAQTMINININTTSKYENDEMLLL